MNWNQACEDLAQCWAHMCPICDCWLLFHILMFLTYILCILQSLIWGQKQYSYCREGLLTLRTLGYLFHVAFIFMLNFWSSIVLASYLSNCFCLFFSFHSGTQSRSPQVSCHNHTLFLVGFCKPAVHYSYVPLYSKITTFSWQKVWCLHLFLPDSSVYWGFKRPPVSSIHFT